MNVRTRLKWGAGMLFAAVMGMVLVGQPAAAKTGKAGKHLLMAQGTVKSIDGNQVVLELENGAVLTLHADQDTKVMLGDKADLKLSSVSEGAIAKVRYSKEGKSLAWIRVKEAPVQKAK